MRPVDEKMIEKSKYFLELHYAKKLSLRTRSRYRQEGAKLFGNHRKILKTRSPRTYYLRKAALAFYATEQMIDSVKRKDLKRFRIAVLTLEKLHTPLVGFAAIEAGNACPIVDRVRKESKRQSLKNLPMDWRDQMLQGVTGVEREWLLLLSIFGMRPDEIARGVILEPYLDGLKVHIKGSKVKAGQGQKERVIYSNGVWESALALDGYRTIMAPSANAVSQFVWRRAQLLFPRKKRRVSAYTYRHQVASDLKAGGLSSEQVSAILGHAVDMTKKLYGSFQQSRRKVSMQLVSSTSPVKIKLQEKLIPKQKPKGPSFSFLP